MHPKRGQITTFIIIGVVLIAVVGVFLYTRSQAGPEEEAVPADVAPIKMYVDQCLKQTAEDAVLDVAAQGGYYFAPQNSINFLYMSVPYYLYEGRVLVPTKEMIEDELSLYVSLNLPYCVDMAQFAEKGYNITAEMPQVKTTITPKEVLFDVDYLVTIRIEGQEKTISKFSTSVNANLMKLYTIASNYTNYQAEDAYLFTISHAVDLSFDNDVKFEAYTFENEIILSFLDNTTLVKNRPLIYTFAMKYLPYSTSRGELSKVIKDLKTPKEECINGNETVCETETV